MLRVAFLFLNLSIVTTVQNIGAEVTRFADRGFYEDWWNSRTFSVFYRKWNGVVHDWIHSYLYTDLVSLCCSLVVLEYVLISCLLAGGIL
jgi:hypothetical protein